MRYAAIVIGGGPAGMAAACAVKENEKVLIIEREARLGGILKQCVHDGFGVIRFGEKLSGPEYADRFIDEVYSRKNIDVRTLTFVTDIEKRNGYFVVTTTSGKGIVSYEGENLILANGCRERTARHASRGAYDRRNGAESRQSHGGHAREKVRDTRIGRHRSHHGEEAHARRRGSRGSVRG